MVREIEGISPLHAKEITVDAALIAIISAYNLRARLAGPHSQSGFTAIAAVSADRAHVIHLPRPGLITISPRGERAHRTDVDAHAALFAVQMIFLIGRNDRTDAAILHAQRPNVHALAADAHAAVAQNAARAIEINYWRPLLLFLVVFRFHELRFGGAVRECHVLQFAFAARIADRAIERMVPQQQLDHGLARLSHVIAVG